MHDFDMNLDGRTTFLDLLKWLWFEIRHGNMFVISVLIAIIYYIAIPYYNKVIHKQVIIEQDTKKLQAEINSLKERLIKMQNRRYGVVGTTTF